jgi:hypothetical protein
MTEIPIGIVAILALVGAHILWVLLPLAPAVLIYWLFPNTPVAVSGPLSGLTVRAGGAFGAYLVVLLLTYGQLRTINQSIAMLESQFWNVRGTVQLVDSKARPIDSPDLLQKYMVVTKPDTHMFDKYEIRLRIVQEMDGSLPITVIKIPEFGEHRIMWASGKKDEFKRTITFTAPLKIQQESSTSIPVADAPTRLGTASVDNSAHPDSSSP